MDRLDCVIRPYAWGSTTAIASIQGREATGQPEAEMWIGAHPGAPSQIFRNDQWHGLDAIIAADPWGELGQVDGSLSFLTKILAAASPLSLQAHPTKAQALAGFATEEAGQPPIPPAERLFRDTNHKPELLCALTPFVALCGFRPIAETIALLNELDIGELAWLQGRLSERPDAAELLTVMRDALGLDVAVASDTIRALTHRLAHPVHGFEPEAHWLSQIIARYGEDPAVIVVLLLNVVELQPGDALFLAAGNLHSYLDGTGIEVLANSDNVIRGGLTSKFVDVATLLDVVNTTPGSAVVQRPTPNVSRWVYDSPVPDFTLTRIDLSVESETSVRGPAVVLPIGGSVTDHDGLTLASGQAGWVAAREGAIQLRGSGLVFITTAGSEPAS